MFRATAPAKRFSPCSKLWRAWRNSATGERVATALRRHAPCAPVAICPAWQRRTTRNGGATATPAAHGRIVRPTPTRQAALAEAPTADTPLIFSSSQDLHWSDTSIVELDRRALASPRTSTAPDPFATHRPLVAASGAVPRKTPGREICAEKSGLRDRFSSQQAVLPTSSFYLLVAHFPRTRRLGRGAAERAA